MTIIFTKDLNFSYGDHLVLKNIHFEINSGDYVGIVGENGSGKSTLLKIILGLLKPTSGEVKIFEEKINQFKSWYKIGYVPQNSFEIFNDIPATVEEVIQSGFLAKSGLSLNYQIDKVLDLAEIKDIRNRVLNSLSGGQRQRVLVARSLINDPKILFLDEPTSGIDPITRTSIYNFMKKLNEDFKITIVQVTHDIDRIQKLVKRVLCIQKNELFDENPKFEHVHD